MWSSLDPNVLQSRHPHRHPPAPHFIWCVRFLLWFQTFSFFFFFHRMMKIWAIMTKTRKEGIRCVNRKISLLSSHFLLFIFLPAAAFTCRSQTRSLGQSPAKQESGWSNEPNGCQQLKFKTSVVLFSIVSLEFVSFPHRRSLFDLLLSICLEQLQSCDWTV